VWDGMGEQKLKVTAGYSTVFAFLTLSLVE